MYAGNGVAIAWWRRTLKGASIANLNHSWAFSTSLKEVFFRLKYFNVIALAALTAKLTIIDGTLMQKALTFYQDVDTSIIEDRHITGFRYRAWPMTGMVEDSAGDAGTMTSYMRDTLKIWGQTGGNYPNTNFKGCNNGFCYIWVEGVGFKFDCANVNIETVNYGKSLSQKPARYASETLFDITFDTVYDDELPSGIEFAHLVMNTTWTKTASYGSADDCSSLKHTTSCRLIPSVIRYPAQIQDVAETHTVSVGPQRWDHWSASSIKHPGLGANPDAEEFDFDRGQQYGYVHKTKHMNKICDLSAHSLLTRICSFEIVRPIHLKETPPFGKKHRQSHLSGLQLALSMSLAGRSKLTLDQSFGQSFNISSTGHADTWLYESPRVNQK